MAAADGGASGPKTDWDTTGKAEVVHGELRRCGGTDPETNTLGPADSQVFARKSTKNSE